MKSVTGYWQDVLLLLLRSSAIWVYLWLSRRERREKGGERERGGRGRQKERGGRGRKGRERGGGGDRERERLADLEGINARDFQSQHQTRWISGRDPPKQLHVLPHWDQSCRSTRQVGGGEGRVEGGRGEFQSQHQTRWISGMYPPKQLHVLPHWHQNCRSNLISHPAICTVSKETFRRWVFPSAAMSSGVDTGHWHSGQYPSMTNTLHMPSSSQTQWACTKGGVWSGLPRLAHSHAQSSASKTSVDLLSWACRSQWEWTGR